MGDLGGMYVIPRAVTRSASGRRDVVTGRLPLIDGLRGMAATWVVVFHLSEGQHIDAIKAWLPRFFSEFLGYGYLGVPIFFVLSGYVMFTSTTGLADKADLITCLRIVLRRVIRLAPPYYLAVILAAIVLFSKSVFLHENGSNVSVGQVLSHVVYAQDILRAKPLSPVFWTLAIEVQFYVFFAGQLWLGHAVDQRFGFHRSLRVLISCSLLLSVAWVSVVSTSVLHGVFVQFWYSFALGAIVAATTIKRRPPYPSFLIAIVILVVGLVHSSAFIVTAALTSLLLLHATASGQVYSWLCWRPLQFIGACSYSIYLFHSTVTGISSRLIVKFIGHSLIEEIVTAIATPTLCIMFAYACYRYVELPAVRWSQRFRPVRPG